MGGDSFVADESSDFVPESFLPQEQQLKLTPARSHRHTPTRLGEADTAPSGLGTPKYKRLLSVASLDITNTPDV